MLWLKKLARGETEPVSPRPHWITIILGLLSPFMALAALGVSLTSYRLSNQSFELSRRTAEFSMASVEAGQRAYVSVTNGTLVAYHPEGEYKTLIDNPPYKGHPEAHQKNWNVIIIAGSFTMHNLGNTPAYIDGLHVTVTNSTGDIGGPLRYFEFDPIEHDQIGVSGELGKGADRVAQFGLAALMDDRNFDQFSKEKKGNAESPATGSGMFFVRARLRFKDVFGREHDASWCWLDSSTSQHPYTCEFDWRDGWEDDTGR
jgi:hypothetical protein